MIPTSVESVCLIFMLFLLILLHAEVSDFTENLPSGCTLYYSESETTNSSEIEVKCSEFNINTTPALLPINTKNLQIYGVKNFPTNVPLVPRLCTLSTLKLPFNFISNVSKRMFEGLDNLSYISLEKNLIKLVPPDLFKNTLKLETVDLSANFILTIESVTVALKNLKYLRSLILYDNKLIRWISDIDFLPLKNSSLSNLDVSLCVIDTVETKAFDPLKFITLNISTNPLSEEALLNLSQTLKSNSIKHLIIKELEKPYYFSCEFLPMLNSTPLEALDASENSFICPPKVYYPNLKSLFINKCDLEALYNDSFSKMPKLEVLLMRNHKLTRIDGEFKTNVQLKYLDLSVFSGDYYSRFDIADYAFENQHELLKLILNNLPFKKNIRRSMFYGLRNAMSLSISASNIHGVDCFAFESLSNLIKLDLSSNVIPFLSNCSFYGLYNVEIIDLSYNQITFMDETYPFQYVPNLEYLILNSNLIAKLPSFIFRNLPNLTYISLEDNAIHPWFHEFLPKRSNLFLLMNKNYITYFTQQMFKDIYRIKNFHFSDNPINCSHCSVIELREWMRNESSVQQHYNRSGYYTCHAPDSLNGTDILTANITSATLHCLPVEINLFTPMCSILSIIAFVAISTAIAWRRWSWDIKLCTFRIQQRTKRYKELVDFRSYEYDACVLFSESSEHWIENFLAPAFDSEDSEDKIRLFLPHRNCFGGEFEIRSINSAIEKSRSTIIVLSNDYLDSEWGLHYITTAQNILFEQGRSGLIFVFLEDIKNNKLTKEIEYIRRTRTCIWWTENSAGQQLFWKKLRNAVIRPSDKGISKHLT